MKMFAGPAKSLHALKVLALSTRLPQPCSRKQRNRLTLFSLAGYRKTVSKTYGVGLKLTRRDRSQRTQEKMTSDSQAALPCPLTGMMRTFPVHSVMEPAKSVIPNRRSRSCHTVPGSADNRVRANQISGTGGQGYEWSCSRELADIGHHH